MAMIQDKATRSKYLAREIALHDEVTRIKEGIEEGRAEGRVEGRTEGKADLLIKQLSQKFKVLPEHYTIIIKGLSEDKLDLISMEIFEIHSLEQLEEYF